MEKYELFCKELQKASEKFRSWDKNLAIKVISHLDADGISACAILINLLNSENRKYSVSILPQLDASKIAELKNEPEKYFIFSDLGSGQLNSICTILENKEVIILDHHEIEKANLMPNVININPHMFGIDGSKEISGAGVVFLFAKQIDKKYNELAHLAIIGAIGDIQDDKGFMKLNKEILQTAIEHEKIKVSTGLRLFGMQTKPLHKVLEYSSSPHIPGVSGSESAAIQFLTQLGINPKNGNDWKKSYDLTEEEMKSLVTGIVMKRLGETSPEDVLGSIYTLTSEKDGSPTRDAREFATLLNACGRMERASCGIGACLGIEKDKQMALQTLADYKKQIVNALKWYDENKKSQMVLKENGFMIINAKNTIPATIIGTLASIISKSNDTADKTYIMSLARNQQNTTKVSLRIKSNRELDIDLRSIVKEIVEKTGGEAGGHAYAAGAIIPTEIEEKFIAAAQEILKDKSKSI